MRSNHSVRRYRGTVERLNQARTLPLHARSAAPLWRIAMGKNNRVIIMALLVSACVGAAPVWGQGSDGLKPGMTLDQSNAQLAQDLLPPEILEHYKTGGYSNPIVDFPLGLYEWPPDFKASTEKNAGQFKVSEN